MSTSVGPDPERPIYTLYAPLEAALERTPESYETEEENKHQLADEIDAILQPYSTVFDDKAIERSEQTGLTASLFRRRGGTLKWSLVKTIEDDGPMTHDFSVTYRPGRHHLQPKTAVLEMQEHRTGTAPELDMYRRLQADYTDGRISRIALKAHDGQIWDRIFDGALPKGDDHTADFDLSQRLPVLHVSQYTHSGEGTAYAFSTAHSSTFTFDSAGHFVESGSGRKPAVGIGDLSQEQFGSILTRTLGLIPLSRVDLR